MSSLDKEDGLLYTKLRLVQFFFVVKMMESQR